MMTVWTFHTHPLEIIWFVFAVCSGILSVFALRDAIIDSAYLAAAGVNGARKVIADSNIRQEAKRLTIGCVMIVCSLASMFLEPPPPDLIFLPQSVMFLCAWIMVAIIQTAASLLDKSARHKLAKYAEQALITDPATGSKFAKQEDGGPAEQVRRGDMHKEGMEQREEHSEIQNPEHEGTERRNGEH